MSDRAPEPIPTGRWIIKFAPDANEQSMRSAMDDDIGAGGDSFLQELKVGVADMSMSQASAMSEREGILEIRQEFYLFDTTRLNAERLEWLRTGARMFLESLELDEPAPDPGPFPWTEQAARFADTPEMTWGLQAVGTDRTALTGSGVKVAVLDTGIDFDHPDFFDRPITARSFAVGEDAKDGNGHGTHVAGTIAGPCASQIGRRYGIASGVELFVGKVLANNGSGREFDVLSGIEWAINQGCHIISMSLGRAVRRNEKPDPLYEAVGQAALDAGCLIIAAAGNESSRAYGYIAPVGSPANASTIMAVASVDPLMKASSFSCGASGVKGGEVDIAAPGSSVYSSWPNPRLSRTISGTSMACPHVSGVAALYAQDMGETQDARRLWERLTVHAKRLGNARDFGAGLVQVPVVPW